MADHKDTATGTREVDELPAFIISERKRFLDENVLTGFEGAPS
jgi:hypothetical protein